MNNNTIDDFKEIQADVKRKVSTAEGKRRTRGDINQHITSTRCETMKAPTSPKETIREQNEFSHYKDDYYDKKNMSPGFNYNTSYLGNDIKENSQKPSAPMFSIGKEPRDKSQSNNNTKSIDVGSTSPEPDKHIRKKSPRATIGNEK